MWWELFKKNFPKCVNYGPFFLWFMSPIILLKVEIGLDSYGLISQNIKHNIYIIACKQSRILGKCKSSTMIILFYYAKTSANITISLWGYYNWKPFGKKKKIKMHRHYLLLLAGYLIVTKVLLYCHLGMTPNCYIIQFSSLKPISNIKLHRRIFSQTKDMPINF